MHKINVKILIREINGILGQYRSVHHLYATCCRAAVLLSTVLQLFLSSQHACSSHVVAIRALTGVVSKADVENEVITRKRPLKNRRVIPIKIAPEGATDLSITAIRQFNVRAARLPLLQVWVEVQVVFIREHGVVIWNRHSLLWLYARSQVILCHEEPVFLT